MTIEEFLKSDPATDIITEYYYDNKKYRIKLFYGYDEPIFGIIDISDLGTDSYKPNYVILSMNKPEYVYILYSHIILERKRHPTWYDIFLLICTWNNVFRHFK